MKTSEPALEEQRSSIQGLAQVAEILTLMITCMLEKTLIFKIQLLINSPLGPSVLSENWVGSHKMF